AGRRAEEDAAALGLEDADDRVHDRGLADAGAAGDDDDLVARRGLDGGALLRRELDAALGLERGDDARDLALRHRRARHAEELAQRVRRVDLVLPHPAEREALAAVAEALADEALRRDEPLDRRLEDVGADLERLLGGEEELVLGRVHVALLGELAEDVKDA